MATKSTALTTIKKPVKRISKLKTDNMRSIVGDSAEEIQQLLESNDSDSATTLLQKKLLQSLTDLIPFAEHAIRKSKGARGVYQLNSLISSVRELLIDIQSTRDRGALGDALVEKIIRPSYLDIGMFLVQEDARVGSQIKDLVSNEVWSKIRSIRSDSLTRQAETIQKQYVEVKEKSIAFLQR